VVAVSLKNAWLSMRIGESLVEGTGVAGRPLLSILFFAAPLLYYPLLFWGLMGMETALLAALLLGAVLLTLRDGDRPRPRPWAAVLLGLVFLTRPDAAIPIAIVFGYRFLRVARQRHGFRSVAVEAAIVAAFVAGISIFRRLYYGEFLPNTFTLKVTGSPIADRLRVGLDFVAPYWESIWIAMLLALATTLVNRSARSAFVLTLPIAALAYQVWIGGEPWPYWRIMAPTAPLLYVVCLAEGSRLLRRGSGRWKGRFRDRALRRVEGLLLVAGLAVLVVSANRELAPEPLLQRPAYFVDYNRKHVDLALTLNEVLEPDASIGVTWGGTLPYYTGLRAVDFLGKSDREIASRPPRVTDPPGEYDRMPGHNKYDLSYSIGKLQPTWIQTAKWGHDDARRLAGRLYRPFHHRGHRLLLRMRSPQVRWDVLRAAEAGG
jgi:hypothetical protein